MRLNHFHPVPILKLLLLFLVYPVFSWFLLEGAATAEPTPNTLSLNFLISPLLKAVYAIVAVGLLFIVAVPLWAAHYRKQPENLARAFRRGLDIASVLLAIVVPIQSLVLALSLWVINPAELWFWGIFVTGGAIGAIVALLQNGFHNEPGIYVTLRAVRIDLADHPKLENELRELTESLGVALPPHILVGLQPEFLSSTATVFCPDGELHNGVLCLSLPTSSILSIAEFRAMTSELLVRVQTSVKENVTQFHSIQEGANDMLRSLNDTIKRWSWLSRWSIHPYLIVFRVIIVAAMRFPLYLGREWLAYYLKAVWVSRQQLDAESWMDAYSKSAQDAGAIQAISALIKEAAVSLMMRFNLRINENELHPLGAVADRLRQEHPQLKFQGHVDEQLLSWQNPVSAWNYLQFRCELSGKNLNWCHQVALDVSPRDPASSLFEDAAALESKILEVLKMPLVMAKSSSR